MDTCGLLKHNLSVSDGICTIATHSIATPDTWLKKKLSQVYCFSSRQMQMRKVVTRKMLSWF